MISIQNLILLLLIILLVNVYLKNRRFWKLIDKFRGDRTIPIFGNALSYIGLKNSVEIFKFGIEMGRRHDFQTFKVQLINRVYLSICEPENIEFILSINNNKITKSDEYGFVRSYLGDGILLSNGNKWKSHRKMVTPAFHLENLKEFINTFEVHGKILIKKMSENIGNVFDVYPLVTLCTLDVICETAMGININAQENSYSDYVKSVYRLAELAYARNSSIWKRFDFLYQFSSYYRDEKKCSKILNGMTDRIIKLRKDHLVNNKPNELNKKNVLLDMLITRKTPEGESLTDQDIRDEVNTFIFGGNETTTCCVSFALYMLANNPAVQNLAFEEQLNIFGNDLSINPTYSELQDMKYLDRVIKETLRMFPPVPVFVKTVIDDITLPDGRIIPAETHIAIRLKLIGLNPKYYPDPLKFDPDRFLSRKYHPYLLIPFSAGSRNCLGQKYAILEIKSLLSNLLRNYELLPGGPGTELKLAPELVLKSVTGIKIKIRNRLYK